jgi:DNA adenine methylase
MATTYVPPIKTQGKKTKLVPWIIENVDFSGCERWVEPFTGSGVVGFNYQPKKALFSDSNPHIINFYQGIKEKKITGLIVREFLEREGKLLLESEGEHFYTVRERFNEEGSPLDFLFINRSCFNGMIRFNRKFKFNVPFCKKPNRFSLAYVTRIVNQVKEMEVLISQNDWSFVCQDFQKTLSGVSSTDFIYCDPPYIGRHVDYYDSWSQEEEQTLHDLLIDSGAKFILSTWHSNKYRENEYLESIWKDCEYRTKEHFYHVGAKESNRNAMNEALLSNYEFPDLLSVSDDPQDQQGTLF